MERKRNSNNCRPPKVLSPLSMRLLPTTKWECSIMITFTFLFREEEEEFTFSTLIRRQNVFQHQDSKECDQGKRQRLILWVPLIPPLSGLFSNLRAPFSFSIISRTASVYFPWHTFFLTSGSWLVFVVIIWLDLCEEFQGSSERCLVKRSVTSTELQN